MFVVRPETPADVDAVEAVIAAAFGSPVEAQLVRNIRATNEHRRELSFVAVDGDVVIGYVMISDAFLDAGAAERHSVLVLSPIGVLPSHQRQGIGRALIDAVRQAADALGEWGVVLQGDPGYYGQFGFEPSANHGITMDLPDWSSDEAAQVLPLANFERAKRGHLVLPASFDDLD